MLIHNLLSRGTERVMGAAMQGVSRLAMGTGRGVLGAGAAILGAGSPPTTLGGRIGQSVGSGIKHGAQAGYRAAPHIGRGVADVAKATVTEAPGGGRHMNPALLTALEVGGVATLALGGSKLGLASSAEQGTPNARMPQLEYSGNNLSAMKNNLGATGDLALALHYNRHG